MAVKPTPRMQQKLDTYAQQTKRGGVLGRLTIDSGGYHTLNPLRGQQGDTLFEKYAHRRQSTVAKILTLGELMRDAGAFRQSPNGNQVKIAIEGAFWQQFTGTAGTPACHTAPGLLTFDSHFPTILPEWANLPNKLAIGRHIVSTFAECVMMPKHVNELDRGLEDSFAGAALVESMKAIVAGTNAQEATMSYQSSLVASIRPLLDLYPADLATKLGYAQRNAGQATAESLLTGLAHQLEENALLARLDDPNHKMLEVIVKVNSKQPNSAEIAQFRALVEQDL